MNAITKILKDSFTIANGNDYDIGRILWALGVLTFCFLAGWAIIKNHQAFDAMSYGGGLAAVLAAGGAALGMKQKTEAP
ncbi:MAG: hypothetical protein ACYCZJ_13120 [Sulfuriferula sp.]